MHDFEETIRSAYTFVDGADQLRHRSIEFQLAVVFADPVLLWPLEFVSVGLDLLYDEALDCIIAPRLFEVWWKRCIKSSRRAHGPVDEKRNRPRIEAAITSRYAF